jgi:plasmid stabilization system protein ParE
MNGQGLGLSSSMSFAQPTTASATGRFNSSFFGLASGAHFSSVPYAVYFAIEDDVVVVVAVLHVSRDPARWQRRLG